MARQDVSCVAHLLHALTVNIQFWIEVRALAGKAHPVVKSGTRTIVDAHVPLAYKRGLVAVVAQGTRESKEPVAGRTAVCIICDAVSVGVLAGEETGAAWRAERGSDKGVGEGYAFSGDAVEV